MTDDEIEKKIKGYQSKLKLLEIQLAKDEQRLKTKEEEQEKIKLKIFELYPEIDLLNLDQEILNLETQLEGEILVFDTELKSIESAIEQNK